MFVKNRVRFPGNNYFTYRYFLRILAGKTKKKKKTINHKNF